jgi:hypothetical protein
MCIQYLHHMHAPSLFPHLLPLLPVPSLSGRTCSTQKKKKKWHFSLRHIHVHMDNRLICFISSIFLLSTSVPFFWLF